MKISGTMEYGKASKNLIAILMPDWKQNNAKTFFLLNLLNKYILNTYCVPGTMLDITIGM